MPFPSRRTRRTHPLLTYLPDHEEKERVLSPYIPEIYLVDLILSYTADVDALFERVLYEGDYRVTKYLLEHTALSRDTLEKGLFVASTHGYLDIVVELTNHVKFDYDDMDNALVLASEEGHLPIVEHLVERNADVNSFNGEALRKAVANDHQDVVSYLIQMGADVRELLEDEDEEEEDWDF